MGKIIKLLFVLIITFIGYWYSQDNSYFQNLSEEDKINIRLIEKVNPSVVSIVWKKNISTSVPKCILIIGSICVKDSNDPDSISTWQVEVVRWSWFFITKNWFILTNRHVAWMDDVDYSITTSTWLVYSASVIFRSATYDLALMRVNWTNFTPISIWNSSNIMVWQTVFAIWNALWQYQNTVTKWIITWLNRKLLAGDWASSSQEIIDNAIQTDASINLWNSWWPLIDSIWSLIWINTAIDVWWQNIWFAIPSNEIALFLSEYSKFLTKR